MAAFLFVVTIPLETESDSLSQVFQSDDEDLKSDYEKVNGDVLAKQVQRERSKEGDDISTATEFFDARSVTSSPQHGGSEYGSLQGTMDSAGLEDAGGGDGQVKVLPKQDSLATTECESFTLEEAVQTLLAILQIEKDVWQKSECNGYSQVHFIVETEKVDTVLRRLTLLGIGRIPDTSVTLFPAQSHFVGIENPERRNSERPSIPGSSADSEEFGERSEFYKSVKARLTVAQVVAGVSANAKLTFDHLMLIILASCIAALGLSENSSVILVASMLISPLMGPILGFTFGIVVENQQLWKMSLRNAGIGLVLCIAMGFTIGLITGGIHGMNTSVSTVYPTSEMSDRGLYHGLLVGVMIAIASGGGVALAVLGGNTASLVGTAISASLLPPAVNAGMLWAFGLLMAGKQSDPVIDNVLTGNDTNVTEPVYFPLKSLPLNNCTKLPGNDYVFHYNCNMSVEAFYLGGVSLLLTILNIICICIMGFAVLKFKEVVPHTAATEGTEMFWKKDIKIARDAYRTLKGKESLDLAKYAKNLAQEAKNKIQQGSKTYHGFDGAQLYREFLQEVEHSPQFQDVVQRVPNVMRTSLLQQVSDDRYSSESWSPKEGSFFNENTPMITPEMVPSGAKRNHPFLRQSTIGNTNATVMFPGFRPRLGTGPRSPSVEDIRWLFEEPGTEDSSSPNVVMEYNVPRRRKRKSGRRPQIRRMPSAPAKVRVVTGQTDQKSRFKVTVIKEEE